MNRDSRLNELARLEAGWLDGSGVIIQTASVDFFHSLFAKWPDIPGGLFPTEEGGLQLEISGLSPKSTSRWCYIEIDHINSEIDVYVLWNTSTEPVAKSFKSLAKTIEFVRDELSLMPKTWNVR